MRQQTKAHALEWVIKTVYIIVLAIITVSIIYPLLFVFFTSFKTYGQFVANPFSISFANPQNYLEAWTEGNFSVYFFNSVFVAATVVLAHVFLSAIVAFAIGRLRFKGATVIMFILLSTMFFTGEITTIPLLILVRAIGIDNTYFALIFTGVLGPMGLGALLGSNHVRGVPKELCEAAVIDGAGIWRVFKSIDFPLMRPILILTAVLAFNSVWSDYMWPMIVMPTNSAHWTLPLGLVRFSTVNNSAFGVLCAGLCIITAPMIIFYSFLSKYFIEGVTAGAVKG